MSNRYSRVTPSQFNPLSLQETFLVPMAKQQQHDQIMLKADELGLFDMNALPVDRATVDDFTTSYRSRIDDLTDDIMAKGIDNMSKGKLRNLISERNNFTSGVGKQIAGNLASYSANKTELDKMYQSGKISRDKYQLGLQQALGNYRGVSAGDTYNPFTAVQDTDFFGKAKEIASAISNNPQKITQFSGLRYSPTTGKYVDTTTNREFTEPEAIRRAVRARLMMDTEVMSDLRQREGLGMLGRSSVEQYVDGLGILNEAVYGKNNVRSTRKFVGVDRSGQDDNNLTNPSFIYGSDRVMKLRDDKLLNGINNILEGNPTAVDRVTGERSGLSPKGRYGSILVEEGPTTFDRLSDDMKTQYNEVFNQLKRSGKIASDVSGSSKEALQQVKSYLDNKRAQEFKFQPIKFTDGLVRNYNDRTAKMNTSTPEQLAKGIGLNPEDYKFIDDKKGRSFNTFNDLPKKYRQELIEGKARVSAAYSARNDFAEKYGDTVREDLLVAPMELQFSDGKKIIVSRPDSERQTPAYRVEHMYNRIWRDMAKFPDIDLPVNMPGLGATKVQSLLQPKIDANGNELEIKITDEQGNVGYATQDQFEAAFKQAYGIK